MIVSPGHAFYAVEGEVGFAYRDDEALLLMGWMRSVITPPGTVRQSLRPRWVGRPHV